MTEQCCQETVMHRSICKRTYMRRFSMGGESYKQPRCPLLKEMMREKWGVCIPYNTMLQLEEKTKCSYSNMHRSLKGVLSERCRKEDATAQHLLWKLKTYAQNDTMHYANTKEYSRVLLYTFKRVPLRKGMEVEDWRFKGKERERKREKFSGPMKIGLANRSRV